MRFEGGRAKELADASSCAPSLHSPRRRAADDEQDEDGARDQADLLFVDPDLVLEVLGDQAKHRLVAPVHNIKRDGERGESPSRRLDSEPRADIVACFAILLQKYPSLKLFRLAPTQGSPRAFGRRLFGGDRHLGRRGNEAQAAHVVQAFEDERLIEVRHFGADRELAHRLLEMLAPEHPLMRRVGMAER